MPAFVMNLLIFSINGNSNEEHYATIVLQEPLS